MRDPDRLKDAATGLSSEWHFEIVLDFILPLAHRGVTLTLVLSSIDEGARGSAEPLPKEVISDLGSAIGGVIRSSDLVARYVDDQFMCLLPLCNLQGGSVFADRIRDSLVDFRARTGATVSAGVSSHHGDGQGTRQEMVLALKGALMAGKFAGGDRVEISEEAWNV